MLKSKYLVDSGDKEIKLYIKTDPIEVLSEIEYKSLNGEVKEGFEEETIKFYQPGWNTIKHIEELSTQLFVGIPNEAMKSRNILALLLREVSFMEIKLTVAEENEYQIVENIDELVSDSGIHPIILDKIDSEIRKYCSI